MRPIAAVFALAATAVLTAGVLGAGLRVRARTGAEETPSEPIQLVHEAYVWQRAWTRAVSSSVAGAPADYVALRVLMAEVPVETEATIGAAVWPAVDLVALARSKRAVIAVVRIDGRRVPEALDLDAAIERARQWRDAGVDVRGMEVDHDCATAALGHYAAWLERERPRREPDRSPLSFSITALPTWAGSPALRRVAAAVDEMVVQVHAVRLPRIFEPESAREGLEAFAATVPGEPLRVALPTYRVRLAGKNVEASVDELGGFVKRLERDPVPGVTGVVWFRLPVAGDDATLPATALLALIRDRPPPTSTRVELEPMAPGLYDVVIVNHGAEPAPWPPISFHGDLHDADLIGGYQAAPHQHRWQPPPRDLAGGGRTVVGWATGKDLRVSVR